MLCYIKSPFVRDIVGSAREDCCIDQSRIGVQNKIGVHASKTVTHEDDLGGRGTEFIGADNLDEFFEGRGVDRRLRDIARYTARKWSVIDG